ncbi:N-acetyltransferase family protein [Phenylobacterium sp.]|uniref:GNAT family N-acetyltransferase n=1 Tax=Phenylobacterium sp. TaxID=1871053 RepID=UPI0035B08387
MIQRRARADDAEALARLHRLTVRASLPFLPELHTPEDDLWFFGHELLPKREVWLAETEAAVVGYIAFRPGWIDHLFVHPEQQGRGIGPQLLRLALTEGSEVRLWTFQKNHRARAFYEARGFALEKLTDGAGNEEQEPDALYVWRG